MRIINTTADTILFVVTEGDVQLVCAMTPEGKQRRPALADCIHAVAPADHPRDRRAAQRWNASPETPATLCAYCGWGFGRGVFVAPPCGVTIDAAADAALEQIEAAYPDATIVGSVTAALAFPGRIVVPKPAAGYHRLMTGPERFRCDAFEAFTAEQAEAVRDLEEEIAWSNPCNCRACLGIDDEVDAPV